jgi:hypothetical protein
VYPLALDYVSSSVCVRKGVIRIDQLWTGCHTTVIFLPRPRLSTITRMGEDVMSSQPVPSETPYIVTRRYRRYPISVPVRVIAEKGDKVVIIQGRGNELNEGGLAVFAGLELKVGDKVAVEFTPAYTGSPIRVRCIVRNRNGYNYGVEFLLDTPNDVESVTEIKSILSGMAI